MANRISGWSTLNMNRLAKYECLNPTCCGLPLLLGTYKNGPKERRCNCGCARWRVGNGGKTGKGYVDFRPGQLFIEDEHGGHIGTVLP